MTQPPPPTFHLVSVRGRGGNRVSRRLELDDLRPRFSWQPRYLCRHAQTGINPQQAREQVEASGAELTPRFKEAK